MKFTPSADDAVNAYIEELPEDIKPLFISIRENIRAEQPHLTESIKWRNCLTYSSARKNTIQTVVGKAKVSLIFFDGIDIDDPYCLLEGDGKRVRTMRITTADFDRAALRSYVAQAAKLAGSTI